MNFYEPFRPLGRLITRLGDHLRTWELKSIKQDAVKAVFLALEKNGPGTGEAAIGMMSNRWITAIPESRLAQFHWGADHLLGVETAFPEAEKTYSTGHGYSVGKHRFADEPMEGDARANRYFPTKTAVHQSKTVSLARRLVFKAGDLETLVTAHASEVLPKLEGLAMSRHLPEQIIKSGMEAVFDHAHKSRDLLNAQQRVGRVAKRLEDNPNSFSDDNDARTQLSEKARNAVYNLNITSQFPTALARGEGIGQRPDTTGFKEELR